MSRWNTEKAARARAAFCKSPWSASERVTLRSETPSHPWRDAHSGCRARARDTYGLGASP